MIVISFALVKFYAFAILYVLIVMQIKLVVVVVVVVSAMRLLLLFFINGLSIINKDTNTRQCCGRNCRINYPHCPVASIISTFSCIVMQLRKVSCEKGYVRSKVLKASVSDVHSVNAKTRAFLEQIKDFSQF